MSSIEPGWYPDPAAPDTQRYWDGEQWIGKALPVDAPTPDGPPEPEPEPLVPVRPRPGTRVDSSWAPPPPGVPPIDRRPPRTPPGAGGRPGLPPGLALPEADLKGRVPAKPGLRLAARLIDVVALLLLNAVVNGYFIYQFMQEMTPAIEAAMRGGGTVGPSLMTERAANLQLTILLVGLLLWFAYEVPMTANTGQTLGKRMVGIKVVPLFGQPMRFGPMAMRWSMMGLPFMFLACMFPLLIIDAAWCLRTDSYRQCLHDKLPGTTVVLASATPNPSRGDADVPPSDPR